MPQFTVSPVPVVVSATDAVTIVKGSRPFAEAQQAAAAGRRRPWQGCLSQRNAAGAGKEDGLVLAWRRANAGRGGSGRSADGGGWRRTRRDGDPG